MKRLLTYFLFSFVLALAACNGNTNTTETTADGSGMKGMAGDSDFKKAHEAPLPADTNGRMGEMVAFNIPSGPAAHGYLVEAPGHSHKYLLMFHEWWGLNDHIKNEADRYAKDLGNVNVLAVDLYDGKVATTPDEASQLTENADDGHLREIIQGAVHYMGDSTRFISLGWCFGGGWSLQSGIIEPSKNLAVVMYYGMPETDIEQLKKLSGPVLGIFGTQDKFINPKVVSTFESNMKKAGKSLTVKNYNATHAFANPSNPTYDKAATEDARQLTLDFLRQHFNDK